MPDWTFAYITVTLIFVGFICCAAYSVWSAKRAALAAAALKTPYLDRHWAQRIAKREFSDAEWAAMCAEKEMTEQSRQGQQERQNQAAPESSHRGERAVGNAGGDPGKYWGTEHTDGEHKGEGETRRYEYEHQDRQREQDRRNGRSLTHGGVRSRSGERDLEAQWDEKMETATQFTIGHDESDDEEESFS